MQHSTRRQGSRSDHFLRQPSCHSGSSKPTATVWPTQNQPTKVTIRWIPAHVGVDGNEFADGEAKSAALIGAGMGVATGPDNPIIRLAAAAKRAVRQRIRERWEGEAVGAGDNLRSDKALGAGAK
ncbi:hypothetical protein ACN42_g11665 [Penicillium freii]|uniref:Uncharacterized protein n=1 Tax=Penicillium freii TaxID=48697 RepID=A0A101M7V7_PENFR|nr:hypothetical protein ACN42_g11665 [Penicillium freii]